MTTAKVGAEVHRSHKHPKGLEDPAECNSTDLSEGVKHAKAEVGPLIQTKEKGGRQESPSRH